MMLPPYVFYLILVIGVPLLGLAVERLVRMHLRKRLAPDPIQKAASHVIVCGMLWTFLFAYRAFFPGEDPVATLAFLVLAIVSPLFSVLSLVGLARVRMTHPVKRVVALFCLLNLVGVAAIWVLRAQRRLA